MSESTGQPPNIMPASAQAFAGYGYILVYGGSFDPPHDAHITLPEQVRQTLGAQLVLYVPAARPPHKLDAVQSDAKHRVAMLSRALADQTHAKIWLDEIERAASGEPSYTVRTLERLQPLLPAKCKLRLLIGADQLTIFDSWYQADRVAALAEPVVMVRPPLTREALLDSLDSDTTRQTWAPRLIETRRMDISATELRQAIARGESPTGIHPDVLTYVKQHNLYS